MDAGQVLQALAIVVPIVAAVLVDGVRTRTRIAVLETKQAYDRAELIEHRNDRGAHWAVPAPPAERRRTA